jgi:hypothetical protein
MKKPERSSPSRLFLLARQALQANHIHIACPSYNKVTNIYCIHRLHLASANRYNESSFI